MSRLGNIGRFTKGSGITKADLVETGIPCVRYGELYTNHNYVIKRFHSFINEEVAATSKRIHKGDILFAGSGETAAEIGKCAAYLGNEEAYAGGDIIILRPEKADAAFLGYSLNHETINRQKAKLGQGYSVVHIYPELLKKIVIPLPPLPEQRKIAAILSTWDRAIELLGKQIATKQRLKKAFMQRLLTGKVRFPEFEEDWKEVHLGEILKSRNEKSPQSEQLQLYSLTIEEGVTPKTDRYDREALVKEETIKEYKIVHPYDIVYNPANLRWGAIGINTFDKSVLVSPIYEVLYLRDPKQYIVELIFAILSSPRQITKFSRFGEGTIYERISVKIKDFLSERIIIPRNYNEQHQIAAFLNRVNWEIGTLQEEQRLYRLQKRGLMQKLLTGEVRVRV